MSMATNIRDFWLLHPEYWIAIGDKKHAIDTYIYDRFRTYDYTKDDLLGQVIYLDQFMRHFSRIEEIDESDIVKGRQRAIAIVKTIEMKDLAQLPEKELIWFLMPWKHMCEWDPIFQIMDAWLSTRNLTEFPHMNRFFMDTYKKAYTLENIVKKIVCSSGPRSYDVTVCDQHPDIYVTENWVTLPIPNEAKPLITSLHAIDKQSLAISLSGGVDSMLMATLLKRTGAEVIAIHIVYGNRAESLDERDFLQTFCYKLRIPLYMYSVEWLKRGQVDRAFYERVTRDIRFRVYQALNRPVLLGHIQEDVVENIWTNIAHGNHLENLAKITKDSMEEGVKLYRPWLHVKKENIYAIAKAMAIPFLKNTTPSWSNRGKFRESFHKATKAQYGENIDEKLLETAERCKSQSDMLDRLLFQPIRESWQSDTKQIDVTQALSLQLDGHSWQRIVKDLAHIHLGVGMPSFSSCDDLAKRVARGVKDGQTIILSKHLRIQFCMLDGHTWMRAH